MRSVSSIIGWRTAALVVLSSGLVWSQSERERPLLLGGPLSPEKREIRLDPRLPTGARRIFSERPQYSEEWRACSFKRPVCVHSAPPGDEQRLLNALEAMESAYRRVVLALNIAAPPSDMGRGGSDALDLYLSGAGSHLSVGLDSVRHSSFDQASSFCETDAVSKPALERAATLCLGEAIGRGLDAGATPHALRAFATHLWWATGNPTALDAEALDDFQARPERAPIRREHGILSEGAAAWFELLEVAQGKGRATALAQGVMTLAASSTDPRQLQWNNEPDGIDVLRRTYTDDPMRMANLMNEWATRRAFVGTRDNGTHVPSLAWAGDFGRVRFDWILRYADLPRRVAATRPIEPTGSIYLLLELDDVELGATLGFQAEWEAPVAFVWSLVQVDREGREMKRVKVPFKERATSTEHRLQAFEGAAYVLLIGTNMGGVDRDHPFDPDVFPYEPHTCTVYLARL